MTKPEIKYFNIYGAIAFITLFFISCGQDSSSSKNYAPEELNFELIEGEWDLQKMIKGKDAIEGGVTIDYITKIMTLETGRFNTYTTTHIPWGSKYQAEVKNGKLFVYNGTQTTYFTFEITASQDGKKLMLENINNGEQEYYIRKK